MYVCVRQHNLGELKSRGQMWMTFWGPDTNRLNLEHHGKVLGNRGPISYTVTVALAMHHIQMDFVRVIGFWLRLGGRRTIHSGVYVAAERHPATLGIRFTRCLFVCLFNSNKLRDERPWRRYALYWVSFSFSLVWDAALYCGDGMSGNCTAGTKLSVSAGRTMIVGCYFRDRGTEFLITLLPYLPSYRYSNKQRFQSKFANFPSHPV